MNLVELRAEGAWSFVLELHPRVTVIFVLGASRRARLGEMVSAAVHGELAGLSATVEVRGEQMEMTPELADELLIREESVDVILRPHDLPGSKIISEEEAIAASALADDQAAHVDAALLERHNLSDLAPADVEFLAEPWSDLETTWAARENFGSAIDEARRKIDPSLPSKLVSAQQELAEAQARRAEIKTLFDVALGPAELLIALMKQLADLELTHAELVEKLGPEVSTERVRAALATLESARAEGDIPRPSAKATELADRWVACLALIAERPPANPPAWLLESTSASMETAKERVSRAEQDVRAATVDTGSVEELERAHAAVLEAEHAAMNKRFGGGGARRSVEKARSAEEEILNRIGIPSYEILYLQQVSHGLDPERAKENLERERAALRDLEAVWEELHTPADDQAMLPLRDEQKAIRAEAAALVGRDLAAEETERVLRAYNDPPPDITAQIEDLWDALAEVGVKRGDPDSDAAATAVEWLASQEPIEQERASTAAELRGCDAELEQIRAEIGAAQTNLAEQGPVAAASEQLDALRRDLEAVEGTESDARARADVAEAALRENQKFQISLEELEAARSEAHREYEEARDRFLEAQQLLKDQRELVKAKLTVWDDPLDVPAVVDVSGVGSADAELYALSRIVGQRLVGKAGSLPLVILDSFAGLPEPAVQAVLDLLNRLSRVVQVIYVTEQPEVEAWAASLTPEEGAVRRFAS